MRSLGLLFFGLAACGAVDSFNDAAPGSDSGHPADASTSGTVNVTTYELVNAPVHTPEAGVPVISFSSDGTQRDEQMSDASGNATLQVHTGDTVVALYDVQVINQVIMVAYADVKPSDHIVYGLGGNNNGNQTPTGVATVNYTNPGMSSGWLYSACNSVTLDLTTTQTAMQFYSNCPATSPLLFIAYDQNGNLFDWARVEGVTTGSSSTVNAPAWQSPITFNMSASGVPANVTNVYASIQDYLSPQGYGYSVYNQGGTPVNGTVTATFPFPRPGSEGFTTQTTFVRDPTMYGTQTLYNSLSSSNPSLNVTNPALLPWLGQVTFDTSSKTASVPQDGGGSFDARLYEVVWNRQGDAGSQLYGWLVIAPPDAPSFSLPTLNGADAYANPVPTDVFDSRQEFAIGMHLPGVTSYDQVRAKELGQLLPFGGTPADGTLFSQSLQPNAGLRAASHTNHLVLGAQ